MKFKHTHEFYQFLQDVEDIHQIKEFREINTGGSSYNFYLKTNLGEFLVKLLQDSPDCELHFQKLKKVWKTFHVFPLKQENFKNYKVLMLPFFKGKKITFCDCSSEVLSRIVKAYNQLLKVSLPSECISEPLDFKKMYAEIEQRLSDKSLWMNRIIDLFFWQRFKKGLIPPQQKYQLIHGDFTVNNILVDENKEVHLIDFECFRYGYDFEDWGNLLLQLSGYKGYLGNFKRLSYLFKEWKKVTPPEMEVERKIPHAVQLFYFKMLYNRLTNSKKRHLRKDFNLLVCLCRYFKLARQLKINVE